MSDWHVMRSVNKDDTIIVTFPESPMWIPRDEALDLLCALWLAGHFSENEVQKRLAQVEGKTHG